MLLDKFEWYIWFIHC